MERVHPFSSMVKVPDPGARIKVTVDTHNDTVEHVGLVLPPAAKGHLSIKLDNGYNVSYPIDDVKTWEERPHEADRPSPELNAPIAGADLPRVRLIHTGGKQVFGGVG